MKSILWAFLLVNTFAIPALADPAPYRIPQLGEIVIDGDTADWGKQGFTVEHLGDATGKLAVGPGFEPSVQIGHDGSGAILLAVTVKDAAFVKSENPTRLHEGDNVELSLRMNPDNGLLTNLMIIPSEGTVKPIIRGEDGAQRDAIPGLQVAAKLTAMGYSVEVRFPTPGNDRGGKLKSVALQIAVSDADPDSKDRFRAVWHPEEPTIGFPDRMIPLQLAGSASKSERYVTRVRYTDKGETEVLVRGTSDAVGQSIQARAGRKSIGVAPMVADGDVATARIVAPLPGSTELYAGLSVTDDKGGRSVCVLPPVDQYRALMRMSADIVPSKSVFAGTAFPTFDFEQPLLMERILGPYTVKTTFYNPSFQTVTTPEEFGRYGAVVELAFESGETMRRYQTVYRSKAGVDGLTWWSFEAHMDATLPTSLPIERDVVAENDLALGTYYREAAMHYFQRDSKWAAALAGLQESQKLGRPANVYEDVYARDRQWWVDFKRATNGAAREFTKPFVCPRPIDGPPARVLAEGSEQDAGIKPGTVAALDAICQEWARESGEPFAACVARRGVVFFYKAYGDRDGKRLTVQDKSWMASISKCLSGTLMMTLVDQGLVDLDADVAAYLPRLRGIRVQSPLHIRHLFTHTNGLQLKIQHPLRPIDHWGDDLHDFEEYVAEYYPHLRVGKSLAYNGAGYALAGKIIESVTGEALPQAFRNHLYGPLGCDRTDAVDMSAKTMSVPMDIARVGQMLLNKGAYGDKRYFSEETFAKMMPTPLRETTGTPVDATWGIGAVKSNQAGLGPNAFGHGAASAATFVMDPDSELVIVMTRNSGGKKFNDYHPKFMQTIADGVVK